MKKYFFQAILLALFIFLLQLHSSDVIIDSDMTFEEAIAGTNAPDGIINNLTILNVEYYSFDNKLHRGQVVISKDVVNDISEIFAHIKHIKFPIKKVIPIVKYD